MARVNIEKELYTDIRFIDLVIKTGSIDTALGCLVRAWTVAQQYWKNDYGLIPKEIWDRQRLNPFLIEVGFIIEKEHGYYASGSETQFEWLVKRVKSGRKGGLAHKKGTPNKINNLEGSLAKLSLAHAKPLTPTLKELNTYTSSGDAECPRNNLTRSVKKKTDLSPLATLWNLNCGNLPKVIGESTDRVKKSNKRWGENPSPEYWLEVIRKIKQSKFCNGGDDGSGWRANFDWLIKPDTAIKILEGQYETKSSPRKSL